MEKQEKRTRASSAASSTGTNRYKSKSSPIERISAAIPGLGIRKETQAKIRGDVSRTDDAARWLSTGPPKVGCCRSGSTRLAND